ncbi:hypothetical protein [Leptolyngbya iicbica]|uniref:Uncharacterized protein n=2 Tax=Cyanophyceae TaxID=3028117 RepID=A0A4Q7E6W4_9CYAN|nr:hypothetical protein [Leptolyngbya sp. LK]RZM78001.1 hypothetical protein DYY88_15770 [Leptolyngbya sp. LK]
MSENRHPELEGHQSEPLYTFELTNHRKAFRNRLLWTLVGVGIGIGGMWLALTTNLSGLKLQPETRGALSIEDPFAQGSRQAMSAAELTQSAQYREEWSQVAILWQQALTKMESVPMSHPSYEIAQQKQVEYARNLQYAQSNIDSRAPINPKAQSYWTIGSDRELVIALQGMPARMTQYGNSCKEVLYYGDSIVELKNGYVVDFSDADGNLKVLGDGQVALSFQSSPEHWAIGSSQAEVFQIQGTPTRTSTFQNAVTLHYGSSIVQLEGDRVIGYTNANGNLKVSMMPTPVNSSTAATFWRIGANRVDVLQAEQQTPTAVSRLDTNCKEVFSFGNSTVTFRQGFVSEYINQGNALNLR